MASALPPRVDVAALDALDDAVDELAHAVLVGFHDLGALGLADLLHDDLLGGLGADPAEIHGGHGFLDEIADLQVFVLLTGIGQQDLALLRFHLLVVRDHFPAAETLVLARVAVDGDPYLDITTVAIARGLRQRGLDGLEDHCLADALLVGDGVHDQQNLFAHFVCLPARAAPPCRIPY